MLHRENMRNKPYVDTYLYFLFPFSNENNECRMPRRFGAIPVPCPASNGCTAMVERLLPLPERNRPEDKLREVLGLKECKNQ
ncbi:hypothetical protein Y032_0339g2967 [Ancylostoma ceylanicum]|uniref:Uncharacterized protein n=1 Tax=Ancylostoma ceylanicum TaxID=53326 RepID=A0A016RY09_9BILA|nr:hypothetical protein Y032_0339g2967 [Ancylostoma ceylanicum]